MANRPPLFAFIDLSASNIDPDYRNNTLTITGFAEGEVIPSREHNTLWLIGSLWDTYLDFNTLKLADIVDLATSQRWSDDRLSYNVGENVLAGGANVDTFASYMFDGWRIQIDENLLVPAGASPLLVPFATTPGRIWIYVDTSVISNTPPLQPIPVLRVDSVAAGDPPTPSAGELALVGVDVDAAGFVTGNTYPAVEPEREVIYGTRVQRWRGQTFYESTANYKTGATSINASSTSATDPAVQIANVSGGDALTVIGPTTLDTAVADAIQIDGGQAQPTLYVGAALFDPSIEVVGNGSTLTTQAAIYADAAGGRALYAFGTTINPVAQFSNLSSGIACSCTNGDTGIALSVSTNGGTGQAISVSGPSSGTNSAVQIFAGANGSIALRAFGTTSSTVYAIEGVGGSTSGSGVSGRASGDGYGVSCESDTTSPVRAALRVVPQNADPTSPQQGDVLFNSSRGPTGKIRVYTTQWESAHSSARGWVRHWGSTASGTTAGGSGNLSLAQITPEQTGNVLVTATGSLSWAVDNGSTTVSLVDVTSGITLVTQTERAIDTDGVAPNAHSFVIRANRLLPNTTTRTFAVVLTASVGTVDYTNVICSVEGVQD